MLTLAYVVYRLIIPDVTLDFSRAGDIACLDGFISIPICLVYLESPLSTAESSEPTVRLPPYLCTLIDPFQKCPMSTAPCHFIYSLSKFRTLGSFQK